MSATLRCSLCERSNTDRPIHTDDLLCVDCYDLLDQDGLTAHKIYMRLSEGGWHPSEYEGHPDLIRAWYTRLARVAAEAANR